MIITNKKFQIFPEDAIRVLESGSIISNCSIYDYLGRNERVYGNIAHRDAIQLIPTLPNYPRYQYCGGMMMNVDINNNKIISNSALQGIFASDGLFRNITVRNNAIRTKSAHWITINGLLSGMFYNNTIADDGRPAPLKFLPLRIGGSADGRNLWILSFSSNSDMKYEVLSGGPGGADPLNMMDWRQYAFNNTDVFLKDFEYEEFFKNAYRYSSIRDIREFSSKIKLYAKSFGIVEWQQ